MAKHRVPSRLSFMAISLPLFFAALALASLFTFIQVGQGRIPVALPPNNSPVGPPSNTPTTTTSAPDITTTVPSSSGSVANKQRVVRSEVQPTQAPTTALIKNNPVPVNTLPPLPLPSNPPSQPNDQNKPLLKVNTDVVELNVPPTTTEKQPLALDAGIEVNVPLLITTLGIKINSSSYKK